MFDKPLHVKKIDGEKLKEVYVRTGRGSIECYAHEAEEFRVEVYAQKMTWDYLFQWQSMTPEDFQSLGYQVYNSGERLSIRSDYAERDFISTFLSLSRVSFRLYLPRNCSVHLETQLGDIKINGLIGNHQYSTRVGSVYLDNIKGSVGSRVKNFGRRVEASNCHGELKISSAGGNLAIRHSSGDIEFNTDGGNVRIEHVAGRLNCRTRGGNVYAEGYQGDLKAVTWGGNIKIVQFHGNVTGNTMGGNVFLDADHIENYAWLETSGGKMEFHFFDDQKLDISARANSIKAQGNFTFQGRESKQRWRGEVNGGGADIRLKTAGGRIKIVGKPAGFQKKREPSAEIPRVVSQVQAVPEAKPPQPIIQAKKSLNENKRLIDEAIQRTPASRWENIPKAGQAMLALLFITLLTYGFNTFIYFASQFLHPITGESDQEIAVFYLNLVNGAIAFFATWFYISVVDTSIRHVVVKYILLVIFIYVAYFITHGTLIALSRGNVGSGRGFFYFYMMLVDVRGENASAQSIFEGLLFVSVPVFAGIAFFAYWTRSRSLNERLSEQELQLLNLEKLKTKAQLNALEARINPHFLYNSLNSIAGLIHENPDKAEDMTIELSKLFRATTGRQDESYHSIEEEINLVKSYLAIEQMRFGERLNYSIDVQPDLNSHRIPRFLLQPLVENAIKHGISKIAGNGQVRIEIHSEGSQIVIEIHDNGPSFGEAMSGGYGLKSVRDKLKLIYEGKASLEIENEPEKKLTILIDKDHAL